MVRLRDESAEGPDRPRVFQPTERLGGLTPHKQVLILKRCDQRFDTVGLTDYAQGSCDSLARRGIRMAQCPNHVGHRLGVPRPTEGIGGHRHDTRIGILEGIREGRQDLFVLKVWPRRQGPRGAGPGQRIALAEDLQQDKPALAPLGDLLGSVAADLVVLFRVPGRRRQRRYGLIAGDSAEGLDCGSADERLVVRERLAKRLNCPHIGDHTQRVSRESPHRGIGIFEGGQQRGHSRFPHLDDGPGRAACGL